VRHLIRSGGALSRTIIQREAIRRTANSGVHRSATTDRAPTDVVDLFRITEFERLQ
jgi:hypothetical protein